MRSVLSVLTTGSSAPTSCCSRGIFLAEQLQLVQQGDNHLVSEGNWWFMIVAGSHAFLQHM